MLCYRTIRSAMALIPLLAFAACSEKSAPPMEVELPPRVTTEIRFTYLAPTRTDTAVARQFPVCVTGVAHTHIHPSWHVYRLFNMIATESERWEITFSDVPVGRSHALRISDPNACAGDPNGASTRNVYANGVLLTNIVSTPGNGPEPGLSFQVLADGTVLP